MFVSYLLFQPFLRRDEDFLLLFLDLALGHERLLPRYWVEERLDGDALLLFLADVHFSSFLP